MNNQKRWVSIFDYSKETGLSISTVRRRIKAKKLVVKKEKGKFFIMQDGAKLSPKDKVTKENQRLREIVLEQDMLIKIYEEKLQEKMDSQRIWREYRPQWEN